MNRFDFFPKERGKAGIQTHVILSVLRSFDQKGKWNEGKKAEHGKTRQGKTTLQIQAAKPATQHGRIKPKLSSQQANHQVYSNIQTYQAKKA